MCEAFVTLATNDEYACGALVWAHSLREVKTTRQVVCLATKQVSKQMLYESIAVIVLFLEILWGLYLTM